MTERSSYRSSPSRWDWAPVVEPAEPEPPESRATSPSRWAGSPRKERRTSTLDSDLESYAAGPFSDDVFGLRRKLVTVVCTCHVLCDHY
jgi:hypothetical protein